MKRFLSVLTALSLALGSACTASEADPEERSVHSVVLTPETASLGVDQQVSLKATALDEEGEPIEGVSFEWASSNPSVAIVEEGVASGKSPGVAAITARAAGVTSNDATLTVTAAEQALFELIVSRDKVPVLQGATETFEVTVVRRNGFTGPVLLTHTDLPEGVIKYYNFTISR